MCGALALLGAALTAVTVATPAHAQPDSGADAAAEPNDRAADPGFLASLRSAGLSFSSNDLAIAAAHSVCALTYNGSTGLDVVRQVKAENPALSMDGAAQFTALASAAYCPEQLTK